MIRRIANAVADLEGLAFLATLFFGIGASGYVVVMWTSHLFAAANYFYAGVLSLTAILVVLFATFRIPFAQLVLLGAAIVVGISFVTGTQAVLLP